MTTNIIQTLVKWFPDEVSEIPSQHPYAEYELLRFFSERIADPDFQVRAMDYLKVINLMYTNGTIHVKNAIENEFLEPLVQNTTAGKFPFKIKNLPAELREGFVKILLETN